MNEQTPCSCSDDEDLEMMMMFGACSSILYTESDIILSKAVGEAGGGRGFSRALAPRVFP